MNPPNTGRVLVAMSGGVDSAVAAAILCAAGHEVAGVTFKLFCYGESEGGAKACCGLEGVRDAQSAARKLGIAHTVLDLADLFEEKVLRDFTLEYAAGRTPNPCVECNTHVKFAPLLDWARRQGFDQIATGHYARNLRPTIGGAERNLIARASDREKDQSYVLWGVNPEVLPFTRFPLGEMRKEEVRAEARALGLPVWDKEESQDICFVPGGDYRAVLRTRLGEGHRAFQPGEIRDSRGALLGRHEGLAAYTVGQRRGLGLGGPESHHVLRLETESNTLRVGTPGELDCAGLTAARLNLFVPPPVLSEGPVMVKVRYRHPAVPAAVACEGERLQVRFQRPQRGIAPGQSCVVYRDDLLLAGGRIESGIP